jgi:hypothetical protein
MSKEWLVVVHKNINVIDDQASTQHMENVEIGMPQKNKGG